MLISRRDFYIKDKIVFGNATFQPPFKAAAPLKNEARFVHIAHGKTRLYSANKHLNLSTGESLIMNTDNFVNNWLENEGGESSEVIVFQLFPDILKWVYNDKLPKIFSQGDRTNITAVEKIPPSLIMDNFITDLRGYLKHPALLNPELLSIKIRELIHILVHTDESGQIRALLSNLFNTREYEFKEIIHSHLFENLSLDDLAFFAGLSLSSFKRKFKSLFGTSPTNYIKNKRLEKAAEMIVTTPQRISEIAFDCGFNDLSYFSKSFTAKFEIPPSEYRKQQITG